MTILEAPEAQTLLEDAVVSAAELCAFARRLEPFLQRYLLLFQRAEQRSHVLAILHGKLSSLSRKTSEPIAHWLGIRRENLQDFVGSSPWADDPVLAELRRHVVEVWHDPDAVLTGDTSGFAKKGQHSCGVKRQYCGRLGKVENCQIGVFLGYACRYGHILLDHRLFLPPEWAADAERRAQTGVPAEVQYQETWEILLDQLERCHDVPHAWFACDSECGRVYAFRAALRERHEQYVVDVRADMNVRDTQAEPPPRRSTQGRPPAVPIQSIATWTEAQPATAWQRFEIRDGEKGPLVVEAVQTWARTMEDGRLGVEERLVVIRTVGATEAKTWYTLSNAPDSVPLAAVVGAHAQRYWEESSLQEGKGEVGMAHYEVRGWRGWHHHMTLTLLALWFLSLERHELQKKTPGITVSVLREAFSRIFTLWTLTLEKIERELNAVLRRTEEARIYHWKQNTGHYPPRRTGEMPLVARAVAEPGPDPPVMHLSDPSAIQPLINF